MEYQHLRRRAVALPAVLAAAAALVCSCSKSGGKPEPPPSGTTAAPSSPTGPAPSGSSTAPHQQPAPTADPSAPGGGSHPASPAPPPWCTTADLLVTVHALQPAAGNRYAALRLTDTASHPCRTEGYPGLRLLDGAGRPLPTTVVRDTSVHPRPLTLAPGGSAWARLHWGAVAGEGDSPTGDCQPPPAALRVIAPDLTTSSSAPWRLGPVCERGRIDEQPLAAGEGPAF